MPPQGTLRALAKVMDFPVDFFSLGDPLPVERADVSFRSLSRLSASQRDAALEAASIANEVAGWFEHRLRLPDVEMPDMRDLDPAAAATRLRQLWGLGEVPAPNLVHLLESKGVRVFRLMDDCATLDALSTWMDDRPFVFLTEHKSAERARWDAAHELGHLVLHLGSQQHGQSREDEADQFAREFLLPERGVMAGRVPFPSLTDVKKLKVEWRVSAMAYIRRLRQLDLITEWGYKSLVIEASQAGYRRTEDEIQRERSKLLPMALDLLRENGITLSDIASDLGLTPGYLRELLFSDLTALTGGQESSSAQRASLQLVD